MPLVVGIDEAGYGPLLGPLVLGMTVWHVAPQHTTADFWDCLGDAVCRSAPRGEARLAVGDSKKIYDRKRGIATLERPVLAFAHAAGLKLATLAELLTGLGATLDASRCPWYRDLTQSLPLDPARSAYLGVAERLTRVMCGADVRCAQLRTAVITEDVFNQHVQRTQNKAAVLIGALLRLMDGVTRSAGDQDVYIHVDRLGGRSDYRTLLMETFPNRHLHVVDQSAARSAYRLAGPRSDWHVSFNVDGDQQYLPIALASMLAKYVREAVMLQFNAWWRTLAPALTPTAGYYNDAQRFLADIKPVLPQARLQHDQFVRSR